MGRSLWGHETCEGRAEMVDTRRGEAGMGGGRRGGGEERRGDAGRSLQNDDPTTQDGWEQLDSMFASVGPK